MLRASQRTLALSEREMEGTPATALTTKMQAGWGRSSAASPPPWRRAAPAAKPRSEGERMHRGSGGRAGGRAAGGRAAGARRRATGYPRRRPGQAGGHDDETQDGRGGGGRNRGGRRGRGRSEGGHRDCGPGGKDADGARHQDRRIGRDGTPGGEPRAALILSDTAGPAGLREGGVPG